MTNRLKFFIFVFSLSIAIGILGFLSKTSPLVCGDISNQYIYSPQKEGFLFGENMKKIAGRVGHKSNCQCCICKSIRGETKGIPKTKEHIQHFKEANNIGRWKKGSIPWNKQKQTEIKCLYCAELFFVSKSRKDRKYCSKECFDESRRGTKINHKLECQCGICKAKRKEFVGVNHPRYKEKINIICEQCGKIFNVPFCRKKEAKFCSYKCAGLYRKEHFSDETREKLRNFSIGKTWEEIHGVKKAHDMKRNQSLFLGGTGIPYEITEYGGEFNETLKEKIRNRDNRTCQICKKIEEENGRKLEVHHIDSDKKNNDINNLIALCLSCHSKTKGERDYWKNLLYLCNNFRIEIKKI